MLGDPGHECGTGEKEKGSVVKQRVTSPLVGHEINLVGHNQHFFKN